MFEGYPDERGYLLSHRPLFQVGLLRGIPGI
jgi:hypothetical protein